MGRRDLLLSSFEPPFHLADLASLNLLSVIMLELDGITTIIHGIGLRRLIQERKHIRVDKDSDADKCVRLNAIVILSSGQSVSINKSSYSIVYFY
jgi:hypothetical protein